MEKEKAIFLALVVRITPVHLIVKCQRRIGGLAVTFFKCEAYLIGA